MGDNFKTCDLHGKAFPHNMIDTRKTKMSKLYVENREDIEGKDINVAMFLGSAENEGIDVCAGCLQEKVLTLLSANGDAPTFKAIQWEKETVQRKDGSGTYDRNNKIVRTVEEIRERIKAEKKKA